MHQNTTLSRRAKARAKTMVRVKEQAQCHTEHVSFVVKRATGGTNAHSKEKERDLAIRSNPENNEWWFSKGKGFDKTTKGKGKSKGKGQLNEVDGSVITIRATRQLPWAF